jgi:hypothetical protein
MFLRPTTQRGSSKLWRHSVIIIDVVKDTREGSQQGAISQPLFPDESDHRDSKIFFASNACSPIGTTP